MGISGVSIGSLLIVLLIVMVLFGTKRLRSIGSDLGGAVKGFRSAVQETDQIKRGLEQDMRFDTSEASQETSRKLAG